MYSLIEDYEERGMAKGMAQQNLELVRRVIATKGMTFNEAAEHLCLTAEEVDAIKPLFEKENQ